jgi:dihydroflavonol-4-reductase
VPEKTAGSDDNGLMRVFVTGGGRGFIGGHVVRALERAGHKVRREWVDVRDGVALGRPMRGCDAVVHVAALYSFTASTAEVEEVNVAGTRNVIAACRASGVERPLYTSSAGTCGPVPGRLASEEDSPSQWELTVPYKRTKLEAEGLVLAAARDGLDALSVNPTTPIAPAAATGSPSLRGGAGAGAGWPGEPV